MENLDEIFEMMLENRLPDYEEEDLELSSEEFCKKYNCTSEQYDQIQKSYQEM